MKKLIAIFLVALLAGFIGGHIPSVSAQSTGPVDLQFQSAKTSCAAIASTTVFCFAADTGILVSINGAATFTQIGGVTSSGVQKVNGVAPGSTGNVTISCPGSTPATAVSVTPAISASGAIATITASGSVPSMAVTTACTVTGS